MTLEDILRNIIIAVDNWRERVYNDREAYDIIKKYVEEKRGEK